MLKYILERMEAARVIEKTSPHKHKDSLRKNIEGFFAAVVALHVKL